MFYGTNDDDASLEATSDLSYKTEESESDDDDDSDSDEASDNTDDPTETEDEPDVSASSVGNWRSVTSCQRAFLFTGKEELCQTPQSSDNCVLPIDVYSLFITDEIIDEIVKETNRYASQKLSSHVLTRKSRLRDWVPTDRLEMKKIIGIFLYMGIVPYPEMHLYWSKSKLYDRELVFGTMSRDRFQLLLSLMHFSDNIAYADQHKIYKVKPLYDMIVERFQNVYKPGAKVVIDETMIPFRGRIYFRQYIQGKSHKYGLKIFKLCNPDGYTWNLEVYCGKGEKYQNLGITDSLCVRLMLPLLDMGMTLYCDNCYTSVTLAEHLLSRNTYLCGTVRSSRKGLPCEVTKAKIKKGDIVSLQNDKGVKVFHWKDKRSVLTLSTVPEYDDALIPTGKRARDEDIAVKPKSVVDYNKIKKGVDVSDQMSSYYTALRKTKKWYRKIAIELIAGTSVVNAWILYNKYLSKKPVSLLNFQESLTLSLLTGSSQEDLRSGKRRVSVGGIRTEHQHYLVEAEGPKRTSRKRCVSCYEMISINEGSKVASKKAKKVSTYCQLCEGNPYMCMSCFATKHVS